MDVSDEKRFDAHDKIARQAADEIHKGASVYLVVLGALERAHGKADAAESSSRIAVPEGQTPLNDKLGHRLLDVLKEGREARRDGTGSPYHGHSLEHCIHAAGWVQQDIRMALDLAHAALSGIGRDGAGAEKVRVFAIGDMVRKKSGSWWEGRVVGFYSTEQTPDGVCVQLDKPMGPVQIYPASALELVR